MSRRARIRGHIVHPRSLRTWIACWTLLALAWPSLGPLPYLVHAPEVRPATADAHEHGFADERRDHVDLASIPGSPAHPADHQCAECEVLKHLSRCVLPVIRIALGAPVVAAITTARIVVARPRCAPFAHLPPVRAPPFAIHPLPATAD